MVKNSRHLCSSSPSSRRAAASARLLFRSGDRLLPERVHVDQEPVHPCQVAQPPLELAHGPRALGREHGAPGGLLLLLLQHPSALPAAQIVHGVVVALHVHRHLAL